MRLLGALMWSFFLLLTLLFERREAGRALAEERGLCLLLAHIKDSLNASPAPLPQVFAAFDDQALAACGFLEKLRSENLAHALDAGLLCLSKEALRPVKEYAAALGKRPYAAERAEAERVLSQMRAQLTESETAYPKRRRLTGTLLFTFGMLALLLLI